MSDITLETVSIPVGKRHITYIDAADADLAVFCWTVKYTQASVYVQREIHKHELPEGIRNKRYRIDLHRVIAERMIGRYLRSGEVVDHADGNTLNNRRSNLRVATQLENARNSRKSKNNTSGYKGVHWHEKAGRWRAMIGGRQKKHIGYFDTPEEAHEAYCKAAAETYGEFARFE